MYDQYNYNYTHNYILVSLSTLFEGFASLNELTVKSNK